MRKNDHRILTITAIILLMAAAACAYLLIQELQKPDVMDEYDYDTFQDMVEIIPEDSQETELQYDPEALLATNGDFLGWLYIPDTTINLPIVAGTDNNWYLNHSFSGEYSSFGCPFLDINTPVGSRSRVIHGHNMGSKRTEMFSRLLDYQKENYAENHKRILFSEPGVEGEEYEVFAVLNFDINYLDEFNYMQGSFSSDDEFSTFVSYLKFHSIFPSEFTPNQDIIILSTCNRAYGKDNRLLICAGKSA